MLVELKSIKKKLGHVTPHFFFSSPGGRGEASYLVEKLDMETFWCGLSIKNTNPKDYFYQTILDKLSACAQNPSCDYSHGMRCPA